MLLEREAEIVERLGVLRLAAGELAVLDDGLVDRAGLQQRGAEIQPRAAEIGMAIDRAPEGHDGAFGIASLHERQTEAVCGVGALSFGRPHGASWLRRKAPSSPDYR